MFFLSKVPVAPGMRTRAAMACGLAVLVVAQGQARAADEDVRAAATSESSLGPVVVSASRMPQLLQTAPIGASIITAEQMARAGVADANEAVRKLGGVAAKSDLNNGREHSLDLRGFGATADQNLVVLVDGVRLSENELAPARLSAIPLDLIDRIEIVRGGNSVLWGDGASSGVVNVILKKQTGDGVRKAVLGAAVESFQGHEVSASGMWGFDGWSLDAAAKRVRSGGFRDNSEYKQDVTSMGARWAQGGLRAGVRIQQEGQRSGLPGQISIQQYRANRRAASTLNDYAKTRETRYLADIGYTAGPLSAQIDMSQREREATAFYAPRPASSSSLIQHQLTPRVSYAMGSPTLGGTLTAGLDWLGWRRDESAFMPTGSQDNRAVFAQGDMRLPTATRLNVGWREERVHRLFKTFAREDKVHAWEMGVNQSLTEGLDVYGRMALSFRMANADENGLTPGGNPLLPQENRDKEIGVKWARDGDAFTLRYFTQKTRNEIIYVDNPVGANDNLDPTRRKGVEVEGRWTPVKDVVLSGTWQQVSAGFRSGPDAGKEMVLIAPHTATLRAAWRVDDRNTLDVGAQYLASMRPANDAANLCSQRIPSSVLFDARYAWSDRVWTVALSGTNLADREGYNYDYSFGCDASLVYPYAGRSLKLSVSRQF